MKPLLTFCLLSLVTQPLLHAQESLSDRWKETQRLNLKQKAVAYTDTLRLSDITKESLNMRRGSFLYKGTIQNDLLDMGALTYGIDKQTNNEIRLRDEEFIHVFSREARDLSAADAAAGKAAIDLPAQPVSAIDMTLLRGSWEVYKRKGKNGPLPKIDYSTLIKGLKTGEATGEKAIGTVSGGQGTGPLYTIIKAEASDLVVADAAQKEHKIKVWRLSDSELVIEDESGIVYYLKHFR
ncbi:hypothetical protein [Taibaiella koreensis]|uniref:hypothetical protein n=1 Tax=Taibaiella koreensis TaxID=1268548 RepID=UPI000E599C61|nr:hypothetical protein [Taibaiella koreensis]